MSDSDPYARLGLVGGLHQPLSSASPISVVVTVAGIAVIVVVVDGSGAPRAAANSTNADMAFPCLVSGLSVRAESCQGKAQRRQLALHTDCSGHDDVLKK
jgi:hypothetical protein